MTGQYEIKCDECKTTIGRTDSLRESAAGGRCDDHSYMLTVSIRPADAHAILEAVGAERDERGRWSFPDHSTFWVDSEAVEYAIKALPTMVFDAMVSA